MNLFLKGLFWGVVVTAAFHFWNLYENNRRWERAAYMHYAAVYTFSAFNDKVEWMWFDDYARKVLLPKAKEQLHATPTPLPKDLHKLCGL